jgi:Pyridoxamine 5'-phosphate oxidase
MVTNQRVTAELVLRHLEQRHFAVLSTISRENRPHSTGVNYGVSRPGRNLALYVMTRTHLQKARNIAQNPNVSLVVPLTSRLLWFLPPPVIHCTAGPRSWTGPTPRELRSSGVSGWVAEFWWHTTSLTIAVKPGSAF